MGKKYSLGEGRIAFYSIIFFVITSALAVGNPPSLATQATVFSLKPDLTIGTEAGNENLVFGNISRVDLDAKGNIYILDYKFRKIVVCDAQGKLIRTIKVPPGQGPREATRLSGIAVTPGGTLFVNDTQKVIVYGPDGEYLKTFLTDFMISSIGCVASEELIAIGPKGGQILHVFDPAGKLLASFGDSFTPPDEFAPMKDMPMFGAPLLFDCAKDGRIFVLNPHKYEVLIFKDRKLEGTISGRSELFRPLQKMGRGIVSTAAHIVACDDLVLVALQNLDPNAKKAADIFRSGRQIGTIDLPGTPFIADLKGRIYIAEEEGFPKVSRYDIK